MLAKRVEALPPGDEWVFEPKWDGFRTLVFRDGEELFIQSRDGKPLNRYFPELAAALLKALPKRCVLDGEIVIAGNGALDFDALQLRLHPRPHAWTRSRCRRQHRSSSSTCSRTMTRTCATRRSRSGVRRSRRCSPRRSIRCTSRRQRRIATLLPTGSSDSRVQDSTV